MAYWTRHNAVGMLTKDFSFKEAACHCGVCKNQIMDDGFMAMLQEVRDLYGKPITMTSGFRCRKWQMTLSTKGLETAAGISSHEMGIAADVQPSEMSPENMQELGAALARVFAKHSIGTAKNFYHVDSRPGGPRRWGYCRS